MLPNPFLVFYIFVHCFKKTKENIMKPRQHLFLKISLVLAALFLSSQAHAYSLMHEYNYRSRTPAGSIAYLNQTVFGSRSQVLSSSGHLTESLASRDFRGFTLQGSFGLENWRFLQTGLTYSHLQSSLGNSRGTSLQGHEFGAESKLVLSSPIFNVSLGGAYFGVSKTFLNGLSNAQLTGAGYRLQTDFSYFFSPRLSWVVSGMMQKEELSSETNAELKDLSLKSYRAGAGLSIWFL
jgi:hypothetical protein